MAVLFASGSYRDGTAVFWQSVIGFLGQPGFDLCAQTLVSFCIGVRFCWRRQRRTTSTVETHFEDQKLKEEAKRNMDRYIIGVGIRICFGGGW